MKNRQILIITHRLYFNNEPKLGGIDRIIAYLKKDNDITLIEHPFELINHPSVFTSKNEKYTHNAITLGPLLWMEELVITISWILQSDFRYDLAIAADPLTFFFCEITKKLARVKKTQFHSTDYSNPRFSNKIFEFVYQRLYRYALKNADVVTIVSDRMMNHAKQVSRESISGKLHLLPNSPNFADVPKVSSDKKNPNNLVFMIGRWGEQVNTEIIIVCLEALIKINKSIQIHVIGQVDKKYKNIFSKHNLDNHIVFHGALTYKSALQKMSECYIGITAYKATESYVTYADSLKIREYAAAGLPIVCDDIYATAEDVKKYNAGFIYKDSNEMTAMIIQLIESNEIYKEKSKNALVWAKEMDKKKLLEKLYEVELSL